MVNDILTLPPSTVGNDVHRDLPAATADSDDVYNQFRIKTSMSFMNTMQVGLGTSFGGNLPVFRFKYQFLGAPILQRKTNWVASVVTGYWRSNDSGDDSDLDNVTVSERVSFDIDANLYELAFLVGYRFSDWIVYVNSFYTHVESETKIYRDSVGSTNFNVHGEHYGAILGVRYDFWFGLYMGAEIVYNNVHIDTVKNQELGTFGVQLGLNWGKKKRNSSKNKVIPATFD